jgi:Ca2+-binding RTX toxin-like protein
MAIINGTPRNDTLNGTAAADSIFGKAGNDVLLGRAGADTLDGGTGRDLLRGGPRRDTLEGGSGRDTLFGGSDGDLLLGEAGNDQLNGEFGRDRLIGGSGRDTLFGSQGRDSLLGRSGNDSLTGGTGNDIIDGGSGTDTAIFSDLKDGYGISLVNDGHVEVADLNVADGNDGADFLTSIEFLQFKDGKLPPPTAVSAIDLGTLNGTNGFTLIGADANDRSGFSVSSAGDVNGDGIDDVIVGAPSAESAGGDDSEGESYVVFGKTSWAGTPSLDLATLDGTNGFRLSGMDAGDRSGSSVSSAGDVNGDGFADLIVGAPFAASAGGADSEGESYVVFGKASWAGTPSLDLATLDGTNGFRLSGIGTYDNSGRSVSSAGDVNGDGFADVIVSAPNAGYYSESYVVFGKAGWAGTPSLDLATLDGTSGFTLTGGYGNVVSSAGDVNGDGFDDVIIGAPNAGPVTQYYGESYVVFGKANWAGTPPLDVTTLDGTNGFRLPGINAYDQSGLSVSAAGDVNGDGFDDVIVGAPGAESADGEPLGAETLRRGESYVIYGKADWAGTPSFDPGMLDGTNGFRLIGIDENDSSGSSVSSAGDVNDDGFADVIVGAPSAESAGGADSEGESYVVFGGDITGAVAHLGGNDDDTLAGTAAAGTFAGGSGNDTLTGNGGADAFQGGTGNDTMAVSTLDFSLADGGDGTDTLSLDGSGLDLDLTALAESKTRSVERIDITGTGDNMLTLSVRDVLDLSDESNELLVKGDAGDVVNQGPGWAAATTGGTNGNGTSTIDGETYQIYTADAAKLLVDTDMTVGT